MYEEWIQPIINDFSAQGLTRRAQPLPEDPGLLNFSSNDYLDLARHPHVVEQSRLALETYGTGSGASRLVTGTLPIHEELETRLAEKKGYPAALVFGSGYMTNAGMIPVLVGRDDIIFADKLVHASIIDACKLSGAKLVRFTHNDPTSLAERLASAPDARNRRLVVTESVFSMDGDLAPLAEIAALAEQYNSMLMVDEAHSTGIFGEKGSGRIQELNLSNRVNVSMGTLSKAFGGYGGYVACSNELRQLLIHSARSFIYTTAPSPAAVGAALGILDVLDASPRLGNILQANSDYFRSLLHDAGLNTLQSESQIIPILVGDNDATVAASQKLREQGIIAAAIRPPTVPSGTARLRLSVTLAHTMDDLERTATAIRDVVDG